LDSYTHSWKVHPWLAVLFVSAWSLTGWAQQEGTYRTGAQTIKVTILSWGDNCGPQPRSSSSRGGKLVPVKRVGAHLAVGGQRTDRCWSRNPKVQRRRAVAGANRWLAMCETAQGDPRYEKGEYVLEVVGDSTLRLREESHYDWRLEGDHCKAKVLLTRSYELVVAAATKGPATKQPESPPPAAKVAANCQKASGTAVRLEIRPRTARVEPGGRVCFRAVGRDDQGCLRPVEVSWTKGASSAQAARGAVLRDDGCFVAGPAGPDALGRVPVVATATGPAGKAPLKASAMAVIRFPDIGDLVAARLEEGDQVEEPAQPQGQPRAGAVQGVTAPTQERRPQLWGWLAVPLVAVALVLLGLALWWRRRARAGLAQWDGESPPTSPVVASRLPPAALTSRKRCPACKREFDDGATLFCPDDATKLEAVTSRPAAVEGAERGDGGGNMICPKCRRGFGAGQRLCPTDSVELVPYAAWRAGQLQERRAQESLPQAMICPQCSGRYDRGTLFCPKDGSKLEPIN
jgi:hypothetical protein